jgi:integrase
MGLHKHPNSPYWYYSFTVQGKRIFCSSKTTNKTLANQIYQAHKVDCLRDEHRLQKANSARFTRLASEFLEWSRNNKRSYKRDTILVSHLTKFFGNRKLEDIKSLDVEKYKQDRREQVSGSTVNREVACLKRMFNLAIEWQLADANPVDRVKFFAEPKRSFQWWRQEDVKKFVQAADDRMRSICSIGVNTGLRIGELLELKWSDLDLENCLITVQKSKAGCYRKIKMNQVVTDTFNGLDRNGAYVFSKADGRPYKRITRAFKSTCKRARLEPATPHVMRHTFASHLTMLGVDPQTIMELGGWKSLDLVMRYSHLGPDHKQNAVEKLGELFK